MKYLMTICLTVLSFPLIIHAQSNKNEDVRDTIDVTYSLYSRFSDIRLEARQEPLEITFDTISESQFNAFKKRYTSKIDTNSSRISQDANSIHLTAADTVFKFRCEQPRPCHYYLGFYPDLNSYLIGALGDGIYETFLIDKETAKGLPMPAFFDASDTHPIISPDKEQILFYSTCTSGPEYCLKWYPYTSVLGVMDMPENGRISDLSAYKLFETKDWVIDELVWIEAKRIALKIYDQIAIDNEGEHYQQNLQYVVGSFK